MSPWMFMPCVISPSEAVLCFTSKKSKSKEILQIKAVHFESIKRESILSGLISKPLKEELGPFQLRESYWCREKLILTPCWNCFFDLLPIAFVIIIIHNGLLQRTLPLCLTVKVPLFRTLPTCRWQETNNIPVPDACHSRRCLQD